jgi:hypothetical protein
MRQVTQNLIQSVLGSLMMFRDVYFLLSGRHSGQLDRHRLHLNP